MNRFSPVSDLRARPLPCTLDELDTPCLLLDEARMERNIDRLRSRLREAGVALRPHLKTAKSWEVSRRMMSGPCGPAAARRRRAG